MRDHNWDLGCAAVGTFTSDGGQDFKPYFLSKINHIIITSRQVRVLGMQRGRTATEVRPVTMSTLQRVPPETLKGWYTLYYILFTSKRAAPCNSRSSLMRKCYLALTVWSDHLESLLCEAARSITTQCASNVKRAMKPRVTFLVKPPMREQVPGKQCRLRNPPKKVTQNFKSEKNGGCLSIIMFLYDMLAASNHLSILNFLPQNNEFIKFRIRMKYYFV